MNSPIFLKIIGVAYLIHALQLAVLGIYTYLYGIEIEQALWFLFLYGIVVGLLFNATSLAIFLIDVSNPDKMFTQHTFLEFLDVWPMILFVVTIVFIISRHNNFNPQKTNLPNG